MDFLSLSRRELQALCKKNKIPANITNVAMVESLKALEMVEGIDELMQACQSGTAQSSIESLDMPEVTSPFVPPTGGRSTRHTNVAKGTLDSVNPATRTRRTTQKTQVKDAYSIETPAPLMAQTNKKKGQMASARLNMESQLKECENEDKKNALITPAVTNRRKKVEESTVKKMYSTRRSVRLAEKSNVKMSNEAENEESQLFKKELVTKYGENEEMNLEDSVDNFNELSDTTDVGATSTVEEKSENKDEPEVVSDQKQDTSVVKDEFEAVSYQKQDTSIGEEIKTGSYTEEEECTNFERKSELEEEKCDNEEDMPLNVSNEVQQNNDGSQDVYISEIEITVEKSTEELKPEEGEASQDEAADFVEDVILESGDNFVVNESSCENTVLDEIKEELYNEKEDGGSKDVTDLNVTLVKLTQLTLQNVVDHLDIPVQLNEDEPNEIEALQLEEIKRTGDPVLLDEPNTDFSEQIPKSVVDVEMTLPSGFEGLENEPNENNKSNEIEILQLEESEKAADQSVESYVDFSEQNPKSVVDVIVQRTCSTPSESSVSKLSMSMMTVFPDNKENIISCGDKLVIMKDVKMSKKSIKNANNLDELSVRKLTKMLKEKLEITKKSSKNENDYEAMSRPVLEAISENLLVGENQN